MNTKLEGAGQWGPPEGSHLACGFDASDDTQVHDCPGCGQAGQQPPLDGAVVADVSRDVQRLPVPEVAHGAAGLALGLEPWNQEGPVRGWPQSSGPDVGSAGLRPGVQCVDNQAWGCCTSTGTRGRTRGPCCPGRAGVARGLMQGDCWPRRAPGLASFRTCQAQVSICRCRK